VGGAYTLKLVLQRELHNSLASAERGFAKIGGVEIDVRWNVDHSLVRLAKYRVVQ